MKENAPGLPKNVNNVDVQVFRIVQAVQSVQGVRRSILPLLKKWGIGQIERTGECSSQSSASRNMIAVTSFLTM